MGRVAAISLPKRKGEKGGFDFAVNFRNFIGPGIWCVKLHPSHYAYLRVPPVQLRDPKDTFVSMWYFYNGMRVGAEPLPFDEAFQMFCKGMSPFGPVWEHYLGYWRESLRRPVKILFLKYEEMVEDPVGNLKKLAEFIGHTFSQEEEKQGIVEGIVRLCSFEKLSSSRGVIKGVRGVKEIVIKNSSYFRKGKVGDWKNHLTPEMAQRLDAITEEKLHGSGLRFSSVE